MYYKFSMFVNNERNIEKLKTEYVLSLWNYSIRSESQFEKNIIQFEQKRLYPVDKKIYPFP